MTDQTNSDGSITVEDSAEDIRISDADVENIEKLKDLVDKLKKKPQEETDREEVGDSEDNEEVEEDDSVIKELEAKIKLLEEANAGLEDKRKEELIALLPKKERVRCKGKSVEAIELLVGYFMDNPHRAIPRTPLRDTNEQTQQVSTQKAGSVGSFNFKTRKWETK